MTSHIEFGLLSIPPIAVGHSKCNSDECKAYKNSGARFNLHVTAKPYFAKKVEHFNQRADDKMHN